jgi:hypothetical protein
MMHIVSSLQLIGLVPLIFGIISVANKTILQNVIDNIPGTTNLTSIVNLQDLINSSAIYIIILGAVIVLIGFLGFCGACCKVKWMIVLVSWNFLYFDYSFDKLRLKRAQIILNYQLLLKHAFEGFFNLCSYQFHGYGPRTAPWVGLRVQLAISVVPEHINWL